MDSVNWHAVAVSSETACRAGASMSARSYARGNAPVAALDHAEGQLAKYRAHLDWMEGLALSPEASRDFIQDIAGQL